MLYSSVVGFVFECLLSGECLVARRFLAGAAAARAEELLARAKADGADVHAGAEEWSRAAVGFQDDSVAAAFAAVLRVAGVAVDHGVRNAGREVRVSGEWHLIGLSGRVGFA